MKNESFNIDDLPCPGTFCVLQSSVLNMYDNQKVPKLHTDCRNHQDIDNDPFKKSEMEVLIATDQCYHQYYYHYTNISVIIISMFVTKGQQEQFDLYTKDAH